MALNDCLRLCGGTFFILFTRAMKEHGRTTGVLAGEHKRVTNKAVDAASISERNLLKGLTKVFYPSMLDMMCTTGALNLESYFDDVEDSVETVAALVQHSLEDMPLEQLESQVERSRNLFEKVANNTDGVLTYYFRIDPEISKNEKGFWYVNLDGEGFKEHEVTDISQYDTRMGTINRKRLY